MCAMRCNVVLLLLCVCALSGHTETIFGAAFDPMCSNTLATCSYDATVKVWHTPTMDLKVSTQTSIYCTLLLVCVNASFRCAVTAQQ
jgi:WD40 repeat protein